MRQARREHEQSTLTAILSPAIHRLVKGLSRRGGATTQEIHGQFLEFRSADPSLDCERTALGLLDLLGTSLRDGGVVRSRTLFLGALTLDQNAWEQVEESGILIDSTLKRHPRLPLLCMLLRDGSADLESVRAGLASRLETYLNLARAQDELSAKFTEYDRLLATRSNRLIKTVLACADIAFLARVAPLEQIPPDLIDVLPIFAQHMPEEIAEIASTVIAEANLISPLSRHEVDGEVFLGLQDREVGRVLKIAIARWALRDLQKSVRHYGCAVSRHEGKRTAYVLRPADKDFDRKFRVSHATGEFAAQSDHLRVIQQAGDSTNLMHVARTYAETLGEKCFKELNFPFPRVRVSLPADHRVLGRFMNVRGLDDYLEQAAVDDLEVPEAQLNATEIRPGLTVGQFRELFRVLRFQTALHSGIVLNGSHGDARLVANSVIPVLSQDGLLRVLAEARSTPWDPETLAAFIDCLLWPRGNPTHLELQYTPLLRLGSRYLVSPRMLLSANALRNALACHQVRVHRAGPSFEERLGTLLRGAFKNVASGKKYSVGGVSGEIDQAVLEGNVLFMFECKHSLPATTVHEHRDLLADVRKGAKQLSRAATVLRQDPQLVNRLRQWFPQANKVDPKTIRFAPCVVTSTRMFSGIESGGVPVRDIFSLENVLLRGRLNLFWTADQVVTTKVYSFWKGEHFSVADFEDYLQGRGVFWKAREVDLRELSFVHAGLEDLVIASETCAITFTSIEDTIAAFDSAGLRLVTERREPQAKSELDRLRTEAVDVVAVYEAEADVTDTDCGREPSAT